MVLVDGHAGMKWERPTHRMAQRQGFLKRVVVTVAFSQRLKQAVGLSIKKEESSGEGEGAQKKSKHMQFLGKYLTDRKLSIKRTVPCTF
jgi:hypothetical protein